MTGSGVPLSKGLSLVGAYRTERPGQRLVPHDNLPPAHSQRYAARAADAAETEASPSHAAASDEPGRSMEQTAPGSVFATLISGTAPQRPLGRPQGRGMPADAPSPVKAPVALDVPLSEIGFGPGMLLRLSQIGVRSTADLARASAAQLRADLGETSRLVDVEAWIRRAREAALHA